MGLHCGLMPSPLPSPTGRGRKTDAKPLLAAVSIDIFHVPIFDPRLQPAPVAGAEQIGMHLFE
jgi:hypothetical protein